MRSTSKRGVAQGRTPLTFALSAPALVFCLFAGVAHGQPARFGEDRKERAVSGIKQTTLTNPDAPPTKEEAKGPVLTVDQFIGLKRGQVMKIVNKQIKQMNRLIRVAEDDNPEKPEFYFRLAELYAEKQRHYTYTARSLDQPVYEAKGARRKQLQDKQKKAEELSQRYLLEAVKAYAGARQFKGYQRMDEVLFKLAYLLQSVKKADKAREVFHELIKDYPNSKYIPDAYLSFAEYYFGEFEMDAALKFYEKVEQFPESSVYGYAVYKKGWCWINLGDFRKALEIFVKVIRLAQSKPGGQWDALEREAKKDVVKAYARVGGPEKAWEFFRRVGGDFAPKMLEALAVLYWTQGMFSESSTVYRKLIALNRTSPRICEWQKKILQNTLSGGAKGDQIQELQRLGAAYRIVGKMSDASAGQKQECKNAFHDTTRELALVWHQEAQKTKNEETYKLVRFVYGEYLKYFSEEEGADAMQFYYAEVLWMIEDWRDAAEQYTLFVEKYPNHKDAQDAAYAAVLAWKNAIGRVDDERPDAKGADGQYRRLEIPPHQQKMIEAFDTYIKYVPNSEELPTIRYRKARVYYEYNHFEDAVVYFSEVVEHHPDTELAVISANLLMDALNILERPAEVLKWVNAFLTERKYALLLEDEDFREQLIALRADSLDVEGRQFEAQGQYKECARSMFAAAKALPESPKYPERLYNAGLCFQKARLIGQAIQVRMALITEHPDDPQAKKALFQVASGYHQLAAYSKASEYYEQYAKQFPGEPESPSAIANATVFRMGLGEYDLAQKNMNDYIRFYGARRPQDSADVFFQMGEVFEKTGDQDGLVRHMLAYLKKWGKKGGVDKQILAHFKVGEILWKKSCPVEGVNGACIEVKRVEASGRARAFDRINRQRRKAGKRLRIPKRTQCGPPTRSKVTIFDRRRNFSGDAKGHFATALKLFNRGKALERIPAQGEEKQSRAALATYAAAGAAFYQAEDAYEAFLRIQFPAGLDFQQPKSYYSRRKQKLMKAKFADSQKRFQRYLKSKSAATVKLTAGDGKGQGLYERVFAFKVAHWTIAAAARVGQVWQNFADQLYTAEIPKDLKEVDQFGNRPREIYCDALVDQAEPIEIKAVSGFQVCLEGATRQSWFNDWSRLCEVELNQMQPSEYPLASEIKPEAGYMATTITPAPLVEELPEDQQTLPSANR